MIKSIIVILIWIAAIVGEILCVVKFFSCDFKESYKAEFVYGFGSVTGLGCVIGYMDVGK